MDGKSEESILMLTRSLGFQKRGFGPGPCLHRGLSDVNQRHPTPAFQWRTVLRPVAFVFHLLESL